MDKYAISNLVGEGSFGKVYKAIDKQTKTTVALKIISKVSISCGDNGDDKNINKSFRCFVVERQIGSRAERSARRM